MCKKNKDGQPSGCPKVDAPPEDEIRRILRGLTPEKRRKALALLRQLKGAGKEASVK